jgi:signal transduction histidine kinase
MAIFSSLKARSLWWILSAMATGMLAMAMWMQSISAWERHLNQAYIAGLSLNSTIRDNAPAQDGVILNNLSGPDSKLADAGLFTRLPDVAPSDFITRLSLNAYSAGTKGRVERIDIAVVAPELQYPIANLRLNENRSSGGGLAQLTRLLASYCATPIVFAKFEQGDWVRIDGNSIWGCGAAPLDLRLAAILLVVVALMILITLVISSSSSFQSFAQMLAHQGLRPGPARYEREGPEELSIIIDAINRYLEDQRRSLSKRAMFLSGVSHDLGTPATRLRLRAEAIKDKTLRQKINNDIDQMTGMITSVLSYTQSEINEEPPRHISLLSLVEAVVADFQDAQQQVTLATIDLPEVTGRTLLFSEDGGRGLLRRSQPPQIVIQAQPMALQRALSNLIDNALKYGRKAIISVEANSMQAKIHIDDFGVGIEPEDLKQLTTPFQRGSNTGLIKGSGIGLAIATTIAEQHGGRLEFSRWESGIRATLNLPR